MAVTMAMAVLACSGDDGDAAVGDGTTSTTVGASAAGTGTVTTSTTIPAPTPGGSTAACSEAPTGCTLRQAADHAGVRMGTALPASRLEDRAATELVAQEFNSLTPENELKWTVVQPEPGTFDFGPADRLVAFAEQHDMEVRGATLIWGQGVGNGVPPWVGALTDPAAVEAAMDGYITATVSRYRGRVHRWDVVNEPFVLSGPALDDNVFHRALGRRYITRALELAHAADPDAEMWINEHSTELVPAKADALVTLAEDLLAAGTPLDGVGLQTHLFSGRPPAPHVLADLVGRLRALGVEVAVTELDLPLASEVDPPPGAATDEAAQAAGYARVVAECLAAGCAEITVWGLDDGATWLDVLFGRTDTDPLLFDEDLRPKPAYVAVRDGLLAGG